MINFFIDLDPTWQAVIALVFPFVASLLIGPWLIRVLRALKAGQPIREAHKGVLAPEHQSKVGTPTMGGIMLIGLVLLFSLICLPLDDPRVQCCIGVTAITAFLGFLDDFAKIRRHTSDGVNGWFKIALQTLAGAGCATYLFIVSPEVSMIVVPFYDVVDIDWLIIPLATLTIIATSNAVNLTDGLDGLASGCMLPACLFFLYIGAEFPIMEGVNPFVLAIMSACVGFLWFNCHPAKVFMGDTGSLALGGALGTVAVCMGMEIMLILLAGVFVAEASSVVIQVFWFKLTRRLYGEGRRFFRMAPLHHHFEKLGWSETQVCTRFWIISSILFVLSVFIISLV